MDKFIIGITGVGRSGKNSLSHIFLNKFQSKGIKVEEFSLAEPLKVQLREYLFKKYKIDVFHCTTEEKSIIRPEIVAHARQQRIASKGKYLTELLEPRIEKSAAEIILINDIRFCEFLYVDEVYWLKDKQGLLVHVARYTQYDGIREYIQPANPDEAHNDPLMWAHSDLEIDWQTGPIEELSEHPQVQETFDLLYKEYLDRKELQP